MKNKRIPFIGFYLYISSLIVLVIAYFIAISTFNVFQYDVDRFVLVFPLLAIWIIVIQIVMSFIDKDKPAWTNVIELAFCALVLIAFAKTLIPFLTNIATYYTVAMGDMKTFAIGVPRCITGCILFIVSCLLFVIGSFFKVVIFKEAKKND